MNNVQARKTEKRTNWIFVAVLLVLIPLVFAVVYMFNKVPKQLESKSIYQDSTTAPQPRANDSTLNHIK